MCIRDRLEPYDGKLSRTVLRGGVGSNASLLPDIGLDAAQDITGKNVGTGNVYIGDRI